MRSLRDIVENNVAGAGQIAGLGIGPKGEPGVSSSTILRRGKFAGKETFIVPPDLFYNVKHGKKNRKWWKKYIGGDDHGKAIREYANQNPGSPVIIENELTGEMRFCRFGDRKQGNMF